MSIPFPPFSPSHTQSLSLSQLAMNNGKSKKRGAPAPPAKTPPQKQHATTEIEEDDMLDEDVFLDETLLHEEEELLLRDMDEREAIALRLAKWKRPALSPAYLSQCTNICECLIFWICGYLTCF